MILRVSLGMVLTCWGTGMAYAQPEAPVASEITIGGEPISLRELLSRAANQAPSLTVARAERTRADAQRAAAEPLMTQNPSISVGFGPRWQGSDVALNAQVGLTHPLPFTGARGARRALADAAEIRGERAFAVADWSLHQTLHAGYRNARIARDYVVIAGRLKAFFDGLVLTAERRVAAGDLPAIALSLAQADAAQAAERVIAATQQYRMVCLQLAAAAGMDPSRPPEPIGPAATPTMPPPLQELIERAREHNPQLALQRAQLLEAEQRVVLAERLGRAVPTLGLQYGYEGSPTGGAGEHVAMGVLTVPLAIYGRNQANRAARSADQNVAEAQLDVSAQVMLVQVQQYRTELAAAVQRIESYGEGIVPRFAANLRALERAFELGELDSTRVSVAAERFLRVQQRALEARAAYSVGLANLEQVVGAEIGPEDEQ